jgi:hypothetical protein
MLVDNSQQGVLEGNRRHRRSNRRHKRSIGGGGYGGGGGWMATAGRGGVGDGDNGEAHWGIDAILAGGKLLAGEDTPS